MKGITFYLLAHGIAKLILRKTRAKCVKQIVIFGKKPTNKKM